MGKEKSWYLKCAPQDMAELVVLVGDPARVQMFAAQMQEAAILAQDREFTTLTGTFQGTRISVVSVGIGAPSAAIVLEELWELGVKVVVRAGTALALNVPTGHYILASGAIRYEGVSPTYLPLEFPAVADAGLLSSFEYTLKEAQAPFATGILATSDGFYTHLFEHHVPEREPLKRPQTRLAELSAWGALGADMETSAIYVIGHYLGLKTLSLLVSTVDGRTSTMLEADIRGEKEKQLANLALNGLHQFTV